jgi:hypothetical protein
MLSKRYPRMYEIFGAYLNQDFDIWGDTVEEIVSCYKEDSSHAHHKEMIDEINCFINEHPTDLDLAFERNYNNGFNPKLWGYITTASFLDDLKKLLQK